MTWRFIPAFAAVLLFACASAHAAVKSETIAYAIDGKPHRGILVYDDARQGKRPGVVIFPAYMGISDNEREHATRLAQAGYVAFIADVYGTAVHPTSPQEATAAMMPYVKDRALYRSYTRAALDVLRRQRMVDTAHISAIGYCFGGMGALELARSGAPLKAVVVFHAVLSNPLPADDKNIKEPVLALQGADDPNMPPATAQAFEKEMDAANVDWQLVSYGHTVHCFTDRHANQASRGCAYNPESERRSWQAMNDLFRTTMH